jgi:hypothetical protein
MRIENLEIGQILHFQSKIRNLKLNTQGRRRHRSGRPAVQAVQSAISDFGLEMQDSSDF